MNLFNRKKSKRLTASDKARKDRLKRGLQPTAQNTLMYTSLFENGLMHITADHYSKTYQLGDVSYVTASQDDKIDIIDAYAEGLNLLDSQTNYQLLIINRRTQEDTLKSILYEYENDGYDAYRAEYNQLIESRFTDESNNFEIDKYITISQKAIDRNQAMIQLQDTGTALANQLQTVDVSLKELDGVGRLRVFSNLLKGDYTFPYTYNDVALSGLTTKAFVAPGRFVFEENQFRINEKYAKILYAKTYPSFLTDKLIRSLTTLGIEVAITIQGQPYEDSFALERINTVASQIRKEKKKKYQYAANQGIDGELFISSHTDDVGEATELWRDEITEHDQKIFTGLIAVYVKADTKEQLKQYTDKLKSASGKLHVELEEAYYYQEEGLNTILPIGLTYLDVRRGFMRDMTTSNIATQVPFTSVDLQSSSPKALYYGQNQLSNNIITLDRKNDLNTGSGVVLGSSGSGKSTTVKIGEIIPTLLKYKEDKIILVDPEDEYSDIGRAFGAQIIDVFPGSNTHLNLLDKPNVNKLNVEDQDYIGHKSNLLMGMFESIMDFVSDEQFGLIDRVTKEAYRQFESPTLKDWHGILSQQPEDEAKNLALKVEQYTMGSNDIFSYPTNINVNNRFIIFNLKKLSGKMKPFALMVLQDYIWNHVVENQRKFTTRIYWDELQLSFKTKETAIFFTELWSRIRKYGAIATGITQNPETLTSMEEGRKLLSNSEFFILLKMKKQDIHSLRQIIHLTDEQIRYIENPKAKGTGLIFAEGKIVPFENPIPRDTKLFQLVETDA
ncbi:VirB4-like conjugal transfer ATPase, CD1110 family [Streptococcus cameli]